jgi:ribonuclease HI
MAEAPLFSIHTDGASRGNPGAAAFAFVICEGDELIVEEAGCLGQMTNNQAEYIALVRALEHALELGPDHRLLIHSDSELLVKQMNGEYRVKNEDLRGLYEQARQLVRQFPQGVTIRHVRRAENSRADALCNEALDGKRLSMPRGPRLPASTEPPTAPVAKSPLHDEAISCLIRAASAWTGGNVELLPETVWEQLQAILKRHGIEVPARQA